MVIDSSIKNITIAGLLRPVKPGEERSREPEGSKNTPVGVAGRGKGTSDVNKMREIAEAISKIERYMNRGIRLEIEDDLDIVVVKVIDKGSGEIIRQIPPAEVIALSKKIREQSGLLIDKEV